MTKIKKKAYIVSVVIVIIASVSIAIICNVVANNRRYSSSLEAFEKGAPKGSELVEILEDKDVAMIKYKESAHKYATRFIYKDDKGWTQMDYNGIKEKSYQLPGGVHVIIGKTENKSIVEVFPAEGAFSEPLTISDNKNSNFVISDNSAFTCGFTVFDGDLPDDYKLYVGNQEIIFG